MPENTPSRVEMTDSSPDVLGQISLPPAPQGLGSTTNAVPLLDSESQRRFDQQVKHYGDILKEDLLRNTNRDFFGNYTWKPYRLNLEQVPKEYHNRVAHYLLQTYKLPEASQHVAFNAPFFHNLDRTALAEALVARGIDGATALAEELHNFKGVDEAYLLESLFQHANFCNWAHNVDVFVSTPHRSIAIRVLEDTGYAEDLFQNHHKLTLNEEDWREIVDKVFAPITSRHVDREFAAAHLVGILHKLPGIDIQGALLKAVSCGYEAATAVAAVLYRHPGLDSHSLADACEGIRSDSPFFKWPNEALDCAIRYLRDFPGLSDEERVRRVLEFRPSSILANLDEHPTLSHLEIALALIPQECGALDLFQSFDRLSKLTAADKEVILDALINSDPCRCGDVIKHFDKFSELDPEDIADKILSRAPSAFLDQDSFFGFTASEMLSRLIKNHGLPQDDDPALFEADSAPVRWIQFGGHGRDIAAAFIEAGEGRLIIDNLSCFTGLTDDDLRKAALQAALSCISCGRVDTARQHVTAHNVPIDTLNQRLVQLLRQDLSYKDRSPEALLRRAGVAAWSLYYPEILQISLLQKRPGLVAPFRKLFGPTDPLQLERNARQKLLENLVSRGIPALIQLRWLRADTIDSLASILPTFLESTTGSESAWRAHEKNLRVDASKSLMERRERSFALKLARQRLGSSASTESLAAEVSSILKAAAERKRKFSKKLDLIEAKQELGSIASSEAIKQRARELRIERRKHPLVGRSVNPQVELKLLRNFYRDFGIIQAPVLYLKRYRPLSVASPGGSAALKDELKGLHNFLAQETPPHLKDLPPEHLEYLSGWSRLKLHGSSSPEKAAWFESTTERLRHKIRHFEEDWEEGSIRMKDPRLSIRCIDVLLASETTSSDMRLPTSTSVLYGRLKERLEHVNGIPLAALFSQERGYASSFLEAQHRERSRWAAAEGLRNPDSQKAQSARAQVERLEVQLAALKQVESPAQLIELLCRMSADRFKGSVITLSLALGLERVGDRDDFLQSLTPTPSEGAVRRIVEFLANEVRDAALSQLDANPKVLRTAEKYLLLPELSKALAQARSEQGNPPFSLASSLSEEIIVLPTRGLLAEIAGFFSDACWTDSDHLLRDHPNATGLIFFRQERPVSEQELDSGSVDLSDAKPLGACYMLRVKDTSGSDVLVLRGVNPREKVIERLNPESFIEKLLDEVMVPFAKAVGATKIVAPFDELGHAQTNRQLISEYLNRKYGNSQYVPLDTKGPKSDFNARLIFDKCRLLRSVPPSASEH